jgi:hypothetical protein
MVSVGFFVLILEGGFASACAACSGQPESERQMVRYHAKEATG